MQKELSKNTSGSNCTPVTREVINHVAFTDEKKELIQSMGRKLQLPTEETYAELPIAKEANQPEKQDDKAPATQRVGQPEPGVLYYPQDIQPNSQADQAKGWGSTLVSVPAKIVSALNPLNWLPGKNTANPEQPKIIIEEDNTNPENSSATLEEVKNPSDNKEDSFSNLDKLTPDDSPFTEESGNNEGTTLTGNNSDLADTQ